MTRKPERLEKRNVRKAGTPGKPDRPESWNDQESRNDQEIRNDRNDRCANILTERSILRG